MPSYSGRDFLLKIANNETPAIFEAIGAARTGRITVNNAPVDATTMADEGVQTLASDAGVQSMEISVDGLFKDAAGEEKLRTAAFAATGLSCQLVFPNGDIYQADFVIRDYTRGGTHDGLETFSATLVRNGPGIYTVPSV